MKTNWLPFFGSFVLLLQDFSDYKVGKELAANKIRQLFIWKGFRTLVAEHVAYFKANNSLSTSSINTPEVMQFRTLFFEPFNLLSV